MGSAGIAISVVVPAYNTEKYLGRCLDSLLAQTFDDFEVIFVDDGSTDNSLSIFEKYAPRFKQAQIIHQENQGLSGARNAGIQASVGSYISFVDSDDWVAPTMLETLYRAAVETKSDIAQVDIAYCAGPKDEPSQPEDEERYTLDSIQALVEMFMQEKYSVCCRLYARHLMEGDPQVFPVGLTCEDRVANFKLISKANQIVVSDRIAYFYFLNYGSISFSGLDKRGFDLLCADERIVAMAKDLGNQQVLNLAEDRAAKGAFSLLIKWARFGITDPNLSEDAIASLRDQYKKDYPRLMASQLSTAKKIAAWQLRYMPGVLKAEFGLLNIVSGKKKEGE